MFKRLAGLFLFLISIFLLWKSNYPSLASGKSNAEWYLYQNSSSAVITQNSFLSNIACVKGEAYTLDGVESPKQFFGSLEGQILFEENLENGTSYYGYSPKIAYSKNMRGQKVNIHLYVSDEVCKVGFPLIYGSY